MIRATGINSGGTLNKRLEELEAAGFIQGFLPLGKTKRDHFYRVTDEFSLFHLKWIEPFLQSKANGGQAYWETMAKTPAVSSWAGLAFEAICFKHSYQIRKALGLEKVACKLGNWQFQPKKGAIDREGAQIDLLFDRQDGVITLCEIKYSEKPFIIDKDYAKKLMQKIAIFETHSKTSKQIFLAFITTMGLKPSIWPEELVQKQVTLEELFS